jgi:hypothetical protein
MNRAWPIPHAVPCLFLALATATLTLPAQESKPSAKVQPLELVRATVANEVAAGKNGAIKFMFRSRKQIPDGVQYKLYVEGNEAFASMTVSGDGLGLTPQVERKEQEHLSQLLNSPAKLRKEHEQEKETLENTLRIVKALPDAFLYKYDGEEPGRPGLGKPGDRLVRLKFIPNPSYSPPSHVEQVLQGMNGYLLIDANAKRLARIDSTLFREVSFGWGIFGHLDKGGHFVVQQGEVADGYWAVTEMNLHITGKILMVKNLALISDEVFTDFQRLPNDLPFPKAVELLKEETRVAQNSRGIHAADTTARR